MNGSARRTVVIVVALVVIVVAAIAVALRPKPAASAGPPPEVMVVPVEQKDVALYSEWIGTLDGLVNASVKAQVTGYLQQQAYQEGAYVEKGQLLFQIDPRPFQAVLDQTEGNLAQAKAQLANAEAVQLRNQLDVDRYTPLAKEQAASQQDLDNAIQNDLAAQATVATAKAQIKSAEAAVETAQLNSGIHSIGSADQRHRRDCSVQVGALVDTSSAPVTTVSTVDPIKVYFTVSESEYLDFNRRFPTASGRAAELKRMPLDLILADGRTYDHSGTIDFADRAVSQGTGSILIAGLFPNPGNILRPGGYGKVRAATSTQPNALVIPQRAVTELQGSYQVAVVDAENKVSIRTVTPGERTGSDWIIAKGLSAGERVVAEGRRRCVPVRK